MSEQMRKAALQRSEVQRAEADRKRDAFLKENKDRECPRCKETKELKEFLNVETKRCSVYCNPCVKAYGVEYRQKKKEKEKLLKNKK